MTSVANTVAMTTLAVHTLQPPIFYTRILLPYITLRHTLATTVSSAKLRILQGHVVKTLSWK